MEENNNKSSEQLHNELWSKIEDINVACDNAIANGMVWNGIKIKLDTESKINFNGTYGLAKNGIVTFPLLMNLGSDMYNFVNINELEQFILSTTNYIQQCYAECWINKNNIENEYNKLINEAINRENYEKEMGNY